MKKFILSITLLVSSISFGQANFPHLDQSDIISYETDIVSKFGGKYESELAIVATFNGNVIEKVRVGKANGSQKKLDGSERKEASLQFKFSVKVLQDAIANLIEKLGDNANRVEIQLMFSRKYSLTTDGSDFRDYPSFTSLRSLKRRLRSVAENFPNGSVWNLVSKVDDVEDFEHGRVALKVRHKVNVLRMKFD